MNWVENEMDSIAHIGLHSSCPLAAVWGDKKTDKKKTEPVPDTDHSYKA